MKTMMKTLGLALATMIVLPAASMAQGMGQQGSGMGTNKQQNPPPTTGQAGQQATPPATPAIDPAEEAAFKKAIAVGATDPKAVAQQGEDFMKKYPNSRYATQIYALMASAYMQMNDPVNAMADGLKSLDKYADNVDALSVLAVVMSRQYNPGQQPDAQEKLQQAEKYARTGIDQLTALQKPTDQTDADFTKMRDAKLAMCYSGLGLVEYKENKSTDAALQFAEAVKREIPPDPVDQYLLGVALMDTKQYAGAVATFQDCLKDPLKMKDLCESGLKEAKQKLATQPTPPKQ